MSQSHVPRIASLLAALCVVGAGLVLGGCADVAGGGSADAPANASAAAPAEAGAGEREAASLYVDRRVQRLSDDRNRLLEGYREALASCQESGIATTPVGSADEARIGVDRWQLWRDGDRVAWRTESWGVDAGSPGGPTMCRFQIELSGQHGYTDGSRSLLMDLATGEVTEEDGNPALFTGAVDAPLPEELQLARSTGDTGPVRRTVAGQPCDEWRSKSGSVACTWTGGTAWGFGHYPSSRFSSLDGLSLDQIVLAAAPAPGTIGDRVETVQFRIGPGLDPEPMQPQNYRESP